MAKEFVDPLPPWAGAIKSTKYGQIGKDGKVTFGKPRKPAKKQAEALEGK